MKYPKYLYINQVVGFTQMVDNLNNKGNNLNIKHIFVKPLSGEIN